MRNLFQLCLIILISVLMAGCENDTPEPKDPDKPDKKHQPEYFDLKVPFRFPNPQIPEDNRMSREGVKLGRMLYYDPIMHGDSAASCASCHQQQYGFTTHDPDSDVPVIPHINLAWSKHFLWDGRIEASTLEEINLFEVDVFFKTDLDRLRNHDQYPGLFKDAFGDENITSERAAKALSQFMRTMISSESRFDRFWRGEIQLTDAERRGYEIFFEEPRVLTGMNIGGADCFHCHGTALFTSGDFHNTGLDSTFDTQESKGRYNVTGSSGDIGAFKAPTLRNVALRESYMHDGRFSTLEEVVDFYNTGGHKTPWTDPFMKTAGLGGLRLTDQEKQDLVTFLHTLTDEQFISNPELSSPF